MNDTVQQHTQLSEYIGVKRVNAKAMTKARYLAFRGWPMLEHGLEGGGEEEGYLVEYLDGGQANTDEYQGYVSWSPKSVFEQAYAPVVQGANASIESFAALIYQTFLIKTHGVGPGGLSLPDMEELKPHEKATLFAAANALGEVYCEH